MKTVSVLLALVVLFPYAAFAGQSASIAVSCTIPAIPGLNAPLMESSVPQQAKEAILVTGEKSQVRTYYVR